MLRRCIALGELIGLPRAKQGAGAAVWETICIVDRLVGLLYNSPIGWSFPYVTKFTRTDYAAGTTAHGLPPRQEVFHGDRVIVRIIPPIATSFHGS